MGHMRCCLGSRTRRGRTKHKTFIVLWEACGAALAQQHYDAKPTTTSLSTYWAHALLPLLINTTIQDEAQHLSCLMGRVRCCRGSTTGRCETNFNTVIVLLAHVLLPWLNCTTIRQRTNSLSFYGTLVSSSYETLALLPWLKNTTMQDEAQRLYRLVGRVRCFLGSTSRRCKTNNNTFIVFRDGCVAALIKQHADA